MSSAGRPRLRKGLSIAAWTAISLLAAAGVLVAVGLPSAKNAVAQVYPHPVGADPAELSVAAQRAPDFDPARPTVAILLAAEGPNIADTLAPYEVFARSGVVNVILVAERAEPVLLGGGLTALPQRTLAQIGEMTGGGPDVIVVSQMHGDRSGEMRWVRDSLTHDPGTVVMSVCVSAADVADAGILDGRRATTHWLKLVGLRRDPGDTEWVDSVRFVEDGPTIGSAGVLSGIDAAMRVVERLGGSAELPRIADEIRWRGYGSGAGVETETPGLRPADLPFALGAAFRWDRPHNGVLLTPGVGEIELASAFRPYTRVVVAGDPHRGVPRRETGDLPARRDGDPGLRRARRGWPRPSAGAGRRGGTHEGGRPRVPRRSRGDVPALPRSVRLRPGDRRHRRHL